MGDEERHRPVDTVELLNTAKPEPIISLDFSLCEPINSPLNQFEVLLLAVMSLESSPVWLMWGIRKGDSPLRAGPYLPESAQCLENFSQANAQNRTPEISGVKSGNILMSISLDFSSMLIVNRHIYTHRGICFTKVESHYVFNSNTTSIERPSMTTPSKQLRLPPTLLH